MDGGRGDREDLPVAIAVVMNLKLSGNDLNIAAVGTAAVSSSDGSVLEKMFYIYILFFTFLASVFVFKHNIS